MLIVMTYLSLLMAIKKNKIEIFSLREWNINTSVMNHCPGSMAEAQTAE